MISRFLDAVAGIVRDSRNYLIKAFLVVLSALLAASAFGAKDYGYIKARGGPDDAAIFVNGKYIGPASRYTVPEKYQVPLGEIEIAIRDMRFEEFATKATVRPGKTVHIHYSLKRREPPKPPFGTLRLTGGKIGNEESLGGGDDGAVYINDRYAGYVRQLTSLGSGMLLNPGTYELHIQSAAFGDIRQQITIEAGQTKVVSLGNKSVALE
jgi:PEGA domain